MRDFYVGQKVVCVNVRKMLRGYTNPILGSVYTIREDVPPEMYVDGAPGILLSEIVNPPEPHPCGDRERPFHSKRFRPVQTTNIDVFLKMLEPTPVKETVS